MVFNTKEIIGIITIILWVLSALPYIHGLRKGTVKPHMFTWVIWSLIMGIGFAVQVSEKGGPGSWLMGLSTGFCTGVALFSFFKGEKNITRSDWVFFIAALAAIPIWHITQSPRISVILITLIEILVFCPTFRKSWHQPYTETISLYALSSLNPFLSIFALNYITINTALYPLGQTIMNGAFALMLVYRRRFLRKETI